MRILFDARSVRTPAGAYVFRGLTSSWLRDGRVSQVLAGVPAGFDRALLPEGVEPALLPEQSWLSHVRTGVRRIADACRADIIFVPNGLPPRDSRAVVYFQDLYHFRPLSSPGLSLRGRAFELARGAWRQYATPACRLAVPVSTDIHDELVRRLQIAIRMIPNGVDVGSIRWTGAGKSIVVMGGHGSRKGEHIAIKAWSRPTSEIRSGLRLEILGAEPLARRSSMERAAERWHVADSVSISGTMPRDELLVRVMESRLAVSCSKLEAFGLPVAEAIAMGAPVIASDVPAHRELVARAGAGATVPVGSVDSLAARLASALNGELPRRLASPPVGWSWQERARQHIDAYQASN